MGQGKDLSLCSTLPSCNMMMNPEANSKKLDDTRDATFSRALNTGEGSQGTWAWPKKGGDFFKNLAFQALPPSDQAGAR